MDHNSTSAMETKGGLYMCPVCSDYFLPPILQCHNGHRICTECRPKLTHCPMCTAALGNIRNLAMEKTPNTLKLPCNYSIFCRAVALLGIKRKEHEEGCEYRPYSCPCWGACCKWQGSLKQVMPHLMMSHESITTLQGEDVVFLAKHTNLTEDRSWVMMQSCFGHHFRLLLEKRVKWYVCEHYFAIVQLIGTRKQTKKFAYKLELNGHGRRLTLEETPKSIHEQVTIIILNSDCLQFDGYTARLFADDGILRIHVSICMV
ncbi:E3 ubiquitin-protein ligase SIAH1B [Cryptotermes secundus]|uniref:E3 ubiquitin-protein ligase n=1 Tax=Cryptotermes secundus TaxID=105785 RepID=A0A2J7PNP1_9NEOP|nr:E3 ubiquitin-protein ligase SIAH1B [Cryptotermes secundus]PNF17957.1 E3 ubiquitin-protein ligase SIAH1B [Cryptotermes secundus]